MRLLTALFFATLLSISAFADGLSGPPSVSSGNSTPTFTNLDPSLLPHWHTAIGKVRLGTGRGKVLILGDSLTAGGGAGTSGTLNYIGARPKSFPTQLASRLNSVLVTTSDQSILANNGVQPSVTYPQYDPRATQGANWGTGAGVATLGGGVFGYTVGAANNFTFTPTAAFDTITLYTIRSPGNGSFTFNVDGGASLGTVSNSGAGAYITTTVTATRGTHTINIVPNNDASFSLAGIFITDSTIPAIDIVQAGVSGSVVATFTAATNPFSAFNVIPIIAPDLTIIELTINDGNAQTPLATYTAGLQSLITQAKLSGDVILVAGTPSNSTQGTNGTVDQYIAAMQSLAVTNNVPMVNMKQRWLNSYALWNAICPYFDGVHPTAICYQDMMAGVILPMIWP